MTTSLHRQRLDAVLNDLLASGATSVVDLGCGCGELLQRLRPHPQFVRLVGIDIDESALAKARFALGIDWLTAEARLSVRFGSFALADASLAGFDAAVMLETIEHIAPDQLSKVESVVFGKMRPGLVLITTPNQEYNILHGLPAGQRRHPGHHFEWSRAQFQHWSAGVAERHGYRVIFADLGPVVPPRGSSTQMARFTIQGG